MLEFGCTFRPAVNMRPSAIKFVARTLACLAFAVAPTFPARAATLIVTSFSDTGAGSLRQSIADAVPGDSISFATNGIITLSQGELFITKNLNIIGPGATNLALNGNSASRVFKVESGVSVTISGLAITNGSVSGFDAGSSPGVAGGPAFGGGLLNLGQLQLKNCAIAGNSVHGGNGGTGSGYFGPTFSGGPGGAATGGGIMNSGTLYLVNCTLWRNTAQGGTGGSAGASAGGRFAPGGNGGQSSGASIYTASTALFLTNCTLSDASVTGGLGGAGFAENHGGQGGNAFGGCLFLESGAATFVHGTLSSNRVAAGQGGTGGFRPISDPFCPGCPFTPVPGNSSGGAVYVASGNLTTCNSIVAGNGPSDLTGVVLSQGYNLIGITNGSSGWTTTDLKGSSIDPLDPRLGPLQDNGGSTPTMALLAGSPAIDQGNSTGIFNDQRGTFRPFDDLAIPNPLNSDGSDIGAFEWQPPPFTWTKTTAPSNSWIALAISADGSRATAASTKTDGDGRIYTSSDSGDTWTPTTAPSANWSALACSADGMKWVAANDTGLYTSTDSGSTWQLRTNLAFDALALSADGIKSVAVAGYNIYSSTNSAASWILTPGHGTCVASSADGYKLAAAYFAYPGMLEGGIFTSTNAGLDWTKTSAPLDFSTGWNALASSADGSKLAATVGYTDWPTGPGPIYTSANSGDSWSASNSPILHWKSIASSADGGKLIALGDNSIFSSTDSGTTWISNNAPLLNWSCLASSADGNKSVAIAKGGGIFLSRSTPIPALKISRSAHAAVLSWIVPSTQFVLQHNSDLQPANWIALTNSTALNLTNLQLEIPLPFSDANHFFRLKH